MKILIDINHPAHVHYFKNMIKIMKEKGHEFKIISRNKEIEHYLLRKYNIDFISRGIGKKTTIGKAFYFFYATFFLFKQILKFKPNVVISFGTPYPAIAAWLLGRPHVSINDTEHAKMHHLLTDPFSKVILTPSCYSVDLGEKQIKFEGYMELSYLSPKYFKPTNTAYKLLDITDGCKYVIIRFVSWYAVHDKGHKGVSLKNKIDTVKRFSKFCRVFISSESKLPEELEKYRINISPEMMHDVLSSATLFFGESATMASESACLGVPSVYLDNDGRGYTDEEEEKYKLVFNYSESESDQQKAIKKGVEIISNKIAIKNWEVKRGNLLKDKIEVTDFFVWFFENYPMSVNLIKNNINYQNNFKIDI